jgi:small-conductance mechanosensitive channel
MTRSDPIDSRPCTIRRCAAALTAVAMLLTCWLAGAAEEQSARQNAVVKVSNRFIIKLYGPIAGHTAAERATGTMERIENVLATDPDARTGLEEAEKGTATRVLLGGKHAFMVTPVDVDRQAGETTEIVARESAARLERAIMEWREHRTPRYLATAAALAAGATLIYGAILWLLIHANRWMAERLVAAAARRSSGLHLGGVRILDVAHLLTLARRLVAFAAWIVAIVLASGWITFFLEQFPYTRPWGEDLEGNLLALLKRVAIAIAESLPGLLLVAIIFLIACAVVRTLRAFFDRIEEGSARVTWIDAETARPTRRIFKFIVWIFALAIAYPYLPGAGTDAFKGLTVLVGVMVSVGGASVVGQAFSGLVLMYNRAFRQGEYVRIGDTEGTVMELGVFITRIRSGLGDEITLPNSGVMATTIRNYSRAVPGTGYVVDTAVTIGYATPWRQVEAMLKEAARRTPHVVGKPAPIVRQTALSDFYVEYRLAAYTPMESPAQRMDVLNRLHGNIQDVFNEHGVQIMSPHYMLDPAELQVVPKNRWYAAPARDDSEP